MQELFNNLQITLDYLQQSINHLQTTLDYLQQNTYSTDNVKNNVHEESFNKSEKFSVQEITNELTPTKLNPNYTFENFVTGPGNQMAHIAATSVASEPGLMYNPCMIYGESGLGKTHLMHAIGNEIKRNNPNARILYSTIENFINDYITSIQTKQQHEFRKKYREIDVLLIDDIQFLTKKKEGIKEEVFRTLNALYQDNKQIIMTCDRNLIKIEGLTNQLINYFNMGLSTDITPPDFETRVAILHKKTENENFTDDALAYIAKHVSKNVRQLEGALSIINLYSLTYSEPIITEEIAVKALKEFLTK